MQATITVEALHEGIDFSLTLTRAKFEELNQDLFKKTLDVSFIDRFGRVRLPARGRPIWSVCRFLNNVIIQCLVC